MSAKAQRKKLIAFVLYPGVTTLDVVGPLTLFMTQTELSRSRCKAVTVGQRTEPIDSDTPMNMIPEYSFAEVPQPFAMVVPGGGASAIRALGDEAFRTYVRSTAATAELVVSIGTGSLILAALGLLEGQQATTNWAYHKVLESFGAHYVRKRWVEDGKFIMSAGVSAGIDAELVLAARLTNEATARQLQLSIEYDPQPPFGSLDYNHMNTASRAIRAGLTLGAPIITARPKRLTRLGR